MKPLLKTSLLIIAMAMVGSISSNTGDERALKFFHTHTGDSLQVIYFRQGEYDTEVLADYGDLNSTLFDQRLKLAELVLNDPVVIQPPGA